MKSLRAFVFYLGYVTVTIVWGSLSVLVAWALPFKARFRFVVVAWTRMVLAWLRVTCGIRFALEGAENIPVEPCVVLVKHSSTWETLFVQRLFQPQTTLIKRELLLIPFFGWAFWLLDPIAIRRQQGREAMRTLIEGGTARLAKGMWVVLFPEGTRMPAGTIGSFQGGGAALAEATGAPVVVVAHDAGYYWPAHVLAKAPGTIRVRISEPIVTTGKKRKEINTLARCWLTAAMADLDALKRPG